MSELFTIPVSLSPRLKWMRKHGVKAERCAAPAGVPEWSATAAGYVSIGTGDTEEEAISALAVKLNLKMWNES